MMESGELVVRYRARRTYSRRTNEATREPDSILHFILIYHPIRDHFLDQNTQKRQILPITVDVCMLNVLRSPYCQCFA